MDTLPRADLDTRGSRARGNRHRRARYWQCHSPLNNADAAHYRNLRSTADPYRRADQHSDIIPHAGYEAYRDSHQHAFDYPFANAYSHAHCNAVANANCSTYLDSNQHTYAIADSRAYSHSYPGWRIGGGQIAPTNPDRTD